MTAASGAPKIATRNVTKIYPSVAGNVTVVDDFSLDVADGEFVCIVGPSGCGKSTFLRRLDRVALSKFADYFPHQISGGMKQRVGIIRALANDPEVLLMDEPLGALDAQTRVVLQEELLRIWEETRKTVVYITHSLDEAVLLGDRVILMSAHPGRHLATFTIDLPRPRGIAAMNTLRFAEYRAEIWDKLSAEVNRAMELQQ
jgi:NitT/TauT family transport system ATP-binding protein